MVVVAGTEDIHWPLYVSLKDSLSDPVLLVDALGPRELARELAALAERHTTYVFPSNEACLNKVHDAVDSLPGALAAHVVVPGTSQSRLLPTSRQITDKASLELALGDWVPRTCRRVHSWVIEPGQLEAGGALALRYPVVLKAATKRDDDWFFRQVPGKLLGAATPAELAGIVRALYERDADRVFIAQEYVEGQTFSWCGYVTNGMAFGYVLTPVIQSPTGRLGGTSTACRLVMDADDLTEAARELAQYLGLDGVFEIEFLRDGTGVVFFGEINPRPWLQVALCLQQPRNIFAEYLVAHGFSLRDHRRRRVPRRAVLWGSAERYITYNAGQISWACLARTIRRDVRLSGYYPWHRRIRYLGRIARLLAATMGTRRALRKGCRHAGGRDD